MIMESSKELIIIKELAQQLLPGCKILLFGSRARNESNTNSDYDILLINPENIDLQIKMQYKAIFRKMAVKHGLMTDIFIESEEDVKEKSKNYGHIIRTAIKEGVFI